MPNPEPPPTLADPATGPAEAESPAAPTIPSFDSLRAPRRRTAVDVLVPGPPPGPPAPGPPPAAAPRPAEYADLVRFGVHVVRTLAGMPLRVAGWAVREPVHLVRRLLGG
jgi:hypothetical protein